MLAYLTTNDVTQFLGEKPYLGQGKEPGEIAADDVKVLEAGRHRGTPILFLGLQEPETGAASALPSSDFTDPETAVANLKGTPFFSMDVADFAETTVDEVLKASSLAQSGHALSFSEPRAASASMDMFTAGLFAEARSMVDWNQRNKFCPACGSPTYSIWAGWKKSCSTLLPFAEDTGRKPCPTVYVPIPMPSIQTLIFFRSESKGLHNFAHPRTDPVVIMLAINQAGDKALLGRNKKFPGKFYSALAGFMEPGESFEDAVAREMWEEAGVKVWDVRYHSGQPWPYPANLMVGFYATADDTQPIRTDLDNELEDAQWFTREQILAILSHPDGTNIAKRDYKVLNEIQDGPAAEKAKQDQEGAAALAHSDPSIAAKEVKVLVEEPGAPSFRVPPVTAIAGVLIRQWAEGTIQANAVLQKGNL
ncbi:hypothetical protein HWV62_31507 [Athelia sp. TMB]|nr:hypothetical protein HWV62_31507 [Athelia sp. TMB]